MNRPIALLALGGLMVGGCLAAALTTPARDLSPQTRTGAAVALILGAALLPAGCAVAAASQAAADDADAADAAQAAVLAVAMADAA